MRWLPFGLLALLAGCVGPRTAQEPALTPQQVQARVAALLPASASDRQGWARDIQTAFTTQKLDPSQSNICAVLAVTEQESTFTADPKVPNLGRIAREEIDRRAARAFVPKLLVDAALDTRSGNGKTWNQRLATVRSERELSALYDELTGSLPLGKTLLGGFNPVRTGGPMQVSIAFAEEHARDYPYAHDGSIRQEVFSRRGGMYFGIAHLLGYPAGYSQPLYRFADFNAGWYASRNAAFQSALGKVTGVKLALDGDLIAHGSILSGSTEKAARLLGERFGMRNPTIREQLEKGEGEGFEETRLYQQVFALADKVAGERVPREVLPGIRLESPKITRQLTTAWFAKRVDERYQRCMKR
jgi:hypothetical protein